MNFPSTYLLKYNYDALTKFYNALDDEFIFLVNNWNIEEVKSETYRAISDLKIKILFEKEIVTTDNNLNNDWSNGIAIFVLEKEKLEEHIYEPSDTDVSNYI